MKRHLALAIAFVALALPTVAQSRMDLDAFGRIVRVADPQIAPDGRSIVMTVSRANFEDNRYRRNDGEQAGRVVLPVVGHGHTKAAHRSQRGDGISDARSHRGHRVAVRRIPSQRDPHVSTGLPAGPKVPTRPRHPWRPTRCVARDVRSSGTALRGPWLGDLSAKLSWQ